MTGALCLTQNAIFCQFCSFHMTMGGKSERKQKDVGLNTVSMTTTMLPFLQKQTSPTNSLQTHICSTH